MRRAGVLALEGCLEALPRARVGSSSCTRSTRRGGEREPNESRRREATATTTTAELAGLLARQLHSALEEAVHSLDVSSSHGHPARRCTTNPAFLCRRDKERTANRENGTRTGKEEHRVGRLNKAGGWVGECAVDRRRGGGEEVREHGGGEVACRALAQERLSLDV